MESIKGNIVKNFKAVENKEYNIFVALKEKGKYSCTDIVFTDKGEIKNIFSELSKDEVKKLMSNMVDEYYKQYNN